MLNWQRQPFDPTDICDEFEGLHGLPGSYRSGDQELLLHTRLARILAQWNLWTELEPESKHRDNAHWQGLRWTTAHSHGKTNVEEPDFIHALNILRPSSLNSPDLVLWTPLFWYGHLRVHSHLATSHAILASDPRSCPCHWDAFEAASQLLESLDAARSMIQLAALPKIYMEAATLAGSILVSEAIGQRSDSDPHSFHPLPRVNLQANLDRLESIGLDLLASPLPRAHWTPMTGSHLLRTLQNLRQPTTARH